MYADSVWVYQNSCYASIILNLLLVVLKIFSVGMYLFITWNIYEDYRALRGRKCWYLYPLIDSASIYYTLNKKNRVNQIMEQNAIKYLKGHIKNIANFEYIHFLNTINLFYYSNLHICRNTSRETHKVICTSCNCGERNNDPIM